MSSNRKKLVFNTFSVSFGCSSCKKLKLTAFFNPKPKPKSPYKTLFFYGYSSSSTSSKKTTHCSSSERETATSFSPSTHTPRYWNIDNDSTCPTAVVRGFGRVGGDSLAVKKDSDDPYLDFRHSMLQMILEKEIYSKDDLKELLNCFLQLNSPNFHGIIVRAFTEIWNGLFSVKHAAGASSKLQFGFMPRKF
ncbi:Transcription repressor OFP8 [Hibiscus syriacus]|uniref:Transcription repressor n=1 Tax=Hibiscus syriacus TaxID=106335 RepID=A0A6A2WWL3_HIBSY|nr:transcription repressor OFP6-like [Hibiscus syriacus]KAE8666183.1 Transcription repressor OFP8 [Hibiscus syriacus]